VKFKRRLKMKKLGTLGSALAVVAMLTPQPALAETQREINASFDRVWTELDRLSNYCSLDDDFSESCGRSAEKAICSVNALSAIIERSGEGRAFAEALSEVYYELGDLAPYLEEILSRGRMQNPAGMSTSEQVRFCREAGAAVQR
jgi:hypothetical protein